MTDMDNQVVVSDYAAMDRVIQKAGCNVLLIQGSILRDGLSVLVVKDIERADVDFLCKTIGCRPIASLDHFTAENMVSADVVEEIHTGLA